MHVFSEIILANMIYDMDFLKIIDTVEKAAAILAGNMHDYRQIP